MLRMFFQVFIYFYRKSAYDVYAPALIGQGGGGGGGQQPGLPLGAGFPSGLPGLPGRSPNEGPIPGRRASFRAPPPMDDNIANDVLTSPDNVTSSLGVDEERPMRRRGSQL